MISPRCVRSVASAACRSGGTFPATVATISRAFGPEIRITATPDGGLPLDSAKIVSGNCICAGLPIALISNPISGRDRRVPLPQANLLSEETSPYLRQHKDNPVHWRPWSEATLAEARELDRPILLSVGYAACHWCHVMAHESFEDPEVAGLMNRLYVNIKVDREERPDIDQIYMAALSATGEQGGWPLTMFLTPDAQPFWGGTYFPEAAALWPPGLHAGAGIHRPRLAGQARRAGGKRGNADRPCRRKAFRTPACRCGDRHAHSCRPSRAASTR